MPKAYSYIRMSTQKQLKGDSLKRQLDLSKEYAEQHNLELDESISDIGISAFKGPAKSLCLNCMDEQEPGFYKQFSWDKV